MNAGSHENVTYEGNPHGNIEFALSELFLMSNIISLAIKGFYVRPYHTRSVLVLTCCCVQRASQLAEIRQAKSVIKKEVHPSV
jgi:hypothetical protein